MCNSRKVTKVKRYIKVGDLVTPVTPAGLCITAEPASGEYYQESTVNCVFKGIGKVILQRKIIIDYDKWDDYHGIGKIEYINCLVECEMGIGWAGQGALRKV